MASSDLKVVSFESPINPGFNPFAVCAHCTLNIIDLHALNNLRIFLLMRQFSHEC